MGIGKLAHVRPVTNRLGTLLPLWAQHYRHDRWFDRRETRSLARLEAWRRALDRPRPAEEHAIVFDHGPLYRLARLREFGPAITRSDSFRSWWEDSRRFWLDALDLIVTLEAPDTVLLSRVEERGHWYLSADHLAAEKQDFLARYRQSFAEILDAPGHPPILAFSTDERSIDAIAADVMAVLASGTAQGDPRERSR